VISKGAASLAFRARTLTVSVCTTGSTTLSATALGFARASGSFITDGFYPGMEVSSTGFSAANNAAKVITGVTAGFLTISGGCAVQSATAGRTIAVGIPSHRAWTNEKFAKVSGFPYFTGVFQPRTSELQTITAAGGAVEETGFYVCTYYALKGYSEVGIWSVMDAVITKFTPGTAITAGSHTIKVRGDTSTQVGDIIPLDDEWTTLQVKIPWRVPSINAIAA
jgi:hypothetical protein